MATESRNPRHGAVDAILGERIRRRRRDLQLSQSALGAKLGITFQQVQKYENGSNRVSAAMLLKLSEAMGVSVVDLLQGVDATPPVEADAAAQRNQLLTEFARISSPEMRAAVLTLVAGLAGR
ncbi:MAG: hypothetical protein JWO33_2761 [Caulobacteraceae bacterium]|nr:hypothetical protein [Caulobacteraceae bacterium]